tara:strand:+ start:2577 stop:3050 length:474 start_codon:yes stop_codon:yes gene_type:complete
MKITKKQLFRIIKESLKNEGIMDMVKDAGSNLYNIGTKIKSGKQYTDIVKASSEDAHELFMSMKGLGTDESKARKILLKRSRDLVKLYQEYGDLLKFLAKMDFDKVVSYALGPGILNAITDNGDLIGWLEDDGLDDEAKMVEAALFEAGVQREMIDV